MNRVSARWVPALSMLLVSLISYIDRNTLALLAPTILKATHLTNQQYGYVITAFSIAYTIGNPLWGRALDRLGLRVGMLLAVTVWTAASVSHVFAVGFLSFFLARAALGFGEGATFPAGLRTVVQTLPPEERARGVAVAYSGGSLGAIVTPLVVTPIALWWGWRAGFWFTGLVGALWLALWLVVSRHPQLRAAAPKRVETPAARLSFRDRRVWGFMAAYAFGALPLGFILYQTSLYLARNWGQSQAGIGKALWIPPLGWEVGYFFWGWVADRRLKSGAQPARSLRAPFTAAMLLSLPFAFTPYLPQYWMALAALFFSMFIASGFLILPVVYATRTYSNSYSGLIAGLGAGAWSAVVAVLMPVFGKMFDLGRINESFAVAALFPLAGWAIWMWTSREPARAVQ